MTAATFFLPSNNSYQVHDDDHQEQVDDDVDITSPPNHFICPLTCEIMAYPVLTKYGHCYEKKSLMQWLNRGHNTCPLSRQPLYPEDIVSCESLQQEIITWKEVNGYKEESYTGCDDGDYDTQDATGINLQQLERQRAFMEACNGASALQQQDMEQQAFDFLLVLVQRKQREHQKKAAAAAAKQKKQHHRASSGNGLRKLLSRGGR